MIRHKLHPPGKKTNFLLTEVIWMIQEKKVTKAELQTRMLLDVKA